MFESLTAIYGPLAGILGINLPTLVGILVVISIWDVVWKLMGMWKAAKNRSPIWFVCMFIFNTVGILPILYLYVFSKKRKK